MIGHILRLDVKSMAMQNYVNRYWKHNVVPKVVMLKSGILFFQFGMKRRGMLCLLMDRGFMGVGHSFEALV